MRRRRIGLGPALLAPLLVVVVYAAGALHWYVPFLTQQRIAVASTPSMQPLFSIDAVRVRPGSRACIAPLPLDPSVASVELLVRSPDRAAPLAIALTAPGYRSRTTATGYDPGDATKVTVPVRPRPARAVDGTLCVRNAGRRAIGLVGTAAPQSVTLPATSVDGGPEDPADPTVTFLKDPSSSSLLDRRTTIVQRASDFTGGLAPTWLVWLLALALLAGTPLAVGGALALGLRDWE